MNYEAIAHLAIMSAYKQLGYAKTEPTIDELYPDFDKLKQQINKNLAWVGISNYVIFDYQIAQSIWYMDENDFYLWVKENV